MKIIEGIEAMIGSGFTGQIIVIFDNKSAIKEYRIDVLHGKLVFGNNDIKEHFIITMLNQELKYISFRNVGIKENAKS